MDFCKKCGKEIQPLEVCGLDNDLALYHLKHPPEVLDAEKVKRDAARGTLHYF